MPDLLSDLMVQPFTLAHVHGVGFTGAHIVGVPEVAENFETRVVSRRVFLGVSGVEVAPEQITLAPVYDAGKFSDHRSDQVNRDLGPCVGDLDLDFQVFEGLFHSVRSFSLSHVVRHSHHAHGGKGRPSMGAAA